MSVTLVFPVDTEWAFEAVDDAPLDVLNKSSGDGVSSEAGLRLNFSAGIRSDPISFGVWVMLLVMLPHSIPSRSNGESIDDMTKSMSLASDPNSANPENILVSPETEN